MDNTETFHNEKMVVAETVGFRFEAYLSIRYRSSRALAVMDNIETFHTKRIVAAETVGFRFEADFFESVQIIQGVGGDGQH